MRPPGPAWAVRWTAWLIVSALWLAVGARCVGGLWTVSGPSMLPALAPGDRVVVDRWTLRHRPPRIGELVILAVPGPNGVTAVKRVTAITADGREVEVRGDNPEQSLDSREFGRVARERILGRVVWRPGQSRARSRLPAR